MEQIDQATDKTDSFTELVNSITSYLASQDMPIKDRLQIERNIKKYQDSNGSDWLLNLIIAIDKIRCQKKT